MSEFVYKLKKKGRVVFIQTYSRFDGMSAKMVKVLRINKHTITTETGRLFNKNDGNDCNPYGYSKRLLTKEEYCEALKDIALQKNKKLRESTDAREKEAKDCFKKSLSQIKESFKGEMTAIAKMRANIIADEDIYQMQTFPELELLEETQ